MKVRLTLRAREDLDGIVGYLRGRSPTGARNVRQAIRTSLDLIGRFPDLGRSSGEAGTRVLPVGRYPYLIYWLVLNGEVRIAHIRHAARERP